MATRNYRGGGFGLLTTKRTYRERLQIQPTDPKPWLLADGTLVYPQRPATEQERREEAEKCIREFFESTQRLKERGIL